MLVSIQCPLFSANLNKYFLSSIIILALKHSFHLILNLQHVIEHNGNKLQLMLHHRLAERLEILSLTAYRQRGLAFEMKAEILMTDRFFCESNHEQN